MDSAVGATRPAGVAAAAHVLGAATNAAEESDSRSPGALQHSDRRGEQQDLKCAFIAAQKLVVIHQKHLAGQHVVRLDQRGAREKNHQKAVVAVARHLAEAGYWILKKQEAYRDPQPKPKAPAQAQA